MKAESKPPHFYLHKRDHRSAVPRPRGWPTGRDGKFEEQTYDLTATYSPDDSKLRLSSATRLDRDVYDRVKAAGFAWAPKQDQFIALMWTPARADLCIELAGEIGDEDSCLIDRAEDRADRFDNYRNKRTDEAERATAQPHRVADSIPFGQPIPVGHHSERHARKDAERIHNGMRKAVQAVAVRGSTRGSRAFRADWCASL